MKTLTVRQARQALTRIEETLAGTAEVRIVRRGKEIARLLPTVAKRLPPSHADLRRSMKRLRTPSARLIREERDER